jgi:hypothetical protein
MMHRLALLFGMFVFPAVLLYLGHRLRSRTAVQRGAFWGGVAGHSTGIAVALGAMQYPPVLWTGGVREWIAFWSLLAAGSIGSAIGALRARPRRD